MIIIKVQGGLGNQLLQYSIGQVIAQKYGKEVAYDISFFEGETKYTKRPYLLGMFTFPVRVATEEEIQITRYPYGKASFVYEKLKKFCNKLFMKRYYIGYVPSFFSTVKQSDSLYLEGFWQSFRYFDGYLEFLNKIIVLKDIKKVESIIEKYELIRKESVAVHVRRGDFLHKNAGTTAIESSYYKEASKAISERVENPQYFIFSDDSVWVKQELGAYFENAVYASDLSLSDYEEFMLMKMCKHAVIANSTFSWFSTLLTYSKEKVVVYPKDWKNPYLNKDKEVCPSDWIGL